MNKSEKLEAIFKQTPSDYKSHIDGVKYVMSNYMLTPLDSLSDKEVFDKLSLNKNFVSVVEIPLNSRISKLSKLLKENGILHEYSATSGFSVYNEDVEKAKQIMSNPSVKYKELKK